MPSSTRPPSSGLEPAYASPSLLRRIAADRIRRLCELPDRSTVTEFAERNRVLPDGRPYDPSVVPYARRPQDLMANPSIEMLVMCWGTQLTKSTSIDNALFYRITQMPSRMMVILPKTDFANNWAKETFRPMVRSSDMLTKRIKLARGEAETTLRYYKFPGGSLFVASAQSASDLSGRSSDFLFFDEVDRMEVIPGEGNPVEIGFRRQSGADIGLAVLTSTPRDAESTIIWPYLEGGSYEFYGVHCPHCGFRQPLLWKQLQWSPENYEGAYYVCPGPEFTRPFLEKLAKDERERRAARGIASGALSAIAEAFGDEGAEQHFVDDSWRTEGFDRDRFAAGGCGAVIRETEKPNMLARGLWLETNHDSRYPSSHLNSLYSPFLKSRWAVLAAEWDRAQAKSEDLQVFINTRLAELWEEKDGQEEIELQGRREFELVEGVVPRGVGALTLAFDVQENRIEGYLWGWGAGLERWPIASILIPGDPQKEPNEPGSIWSQVDEFRTRVWPHQDSNGIAFVKPEITFIDSGFATTQVYRYTHDLAVERVFACKGDDGPIPICGKPTTQGAHKTVVYIVGSDSAKNEFLRSSILETKRGPGFCHVPGWFTESQCKQLVSERRKKRIVRGRLVRYWGKKSHDDPNEALDCQNYARAAIEALGPAAIAQLGEAAEQLAEKAHALAIAGQHTPAAPAGSGQSRMISRGIRSDW